MKPIIVAGNGPSLSKIDYKRLPKDFDVFRCNQFYFEDRYFVGRKIKGVFFNYEIFQEQFYTLHHLVENDEYEVDQIFCNICLHSQHNKINKSDFKDRFSSVQSTYKFLECNKKFKSLLDFYYAYHGQHYTSGVIMLIAALALGYKEIYLTGIDFYGGGGQTMPLVYKIKMSCIKKYLDSLKNSICKKPVIVKP